MFLDDLFFIENGILTGDVMLNGSFSNPEFSGAVEISSPVMKLPSVTEKKIFGTDVVINFNNNELLFDKITLKTKNNEKVDIDLSLFLISNQRHVRFSVFLFYYLLLIPFVAVVEFPACYYYY